MQPRKDRMRGFWALTRSSAQSRAVTPSGRETGWLPTRMTWRGIALIGPLRGREKPYHHEGPGGNREERKKEPRGENPIGGRGLFRSDRRGKRFRGQGPDAPTSQSQGM